MKLNDFDYLLDLTGEEQERRWLQERLETLSVREGTVLAAAALKDPPEDMAQAINQLQALDEYTIRLDAGSYEALGMAYLLNETKMPGNALPFVDLTQMGTHYEDSPLTKLAAMKKRLREQAHLNYLDSNSLDTGISSALAISSNAITLGVAFAVSICWI